MKEIKLNISDITSAALIYGSKVEINLLIVEAKMSGAAMSNVNEEIVTATAGHIPS